MFSPDGLFDSAQSRLDSEFPAMFTRKGIRGWMTPLLV